jgi:hypothetical protein
MATSNAQKKLREKIQQAQSLFFTRASRLLDDAEDVRRERDRLAELLQQAGTLQFSEDGEAGK